MKQLKTPGVYRDGQGLLLRVDPNGRKRWVLRTTVHGKRRDIGLGSALDVSLADAREAAAESRKVARTGRDPVVVRREARGRSITFEQAARKVHDQRSGTWRNEKHRAQWLTTLETYAFPRLGMKPLAAIEPGDVLEVLIPLWLVKPETARRLRQRIRVVLEWGQAAGHRPAFAANPADLVRSGLPKQTQRVRHHPALPWREVPAFIVRLRASPADAASRLALEFLTLTAARSGEVRGAGWAEIDIGTGVWTIPAERMKGARQHRVPLAPAVIQILLETRELWPKSELIFPGRKEASSLSDMALTMVLRRLEVPAVAHGFRSSFRDWAADTGKPRDLAEASLAHALPDRTEAAYQRSDLLDARRPLMEEWAKHVIGCGPI